MQSQEVVEAQGHLIDSTSMELIFDKVVEYNSRFEVEQFRIGRTNSDPSYLRLKVEAPNGEVMDHLLQSLSRVRPARLSIRVNAQLRQVERDRCAPEDFYSTTNHRTLDPQRASSGLKWRTSAWTPSSWWRDGACHLPAAPRYPRRRRTWWLGTRGIRVVPEIEGARPPVFRLSCRTDFLRTAARNRRAPDCGARESDPRSKS